MNKVLENAALWLHRTRRKLATAAIGALLCLIGYGAIFGANGFLVFHQKRVESQRLDREIQSLQQENARSEQEIKALKSDPQAIEKEAREHLHYAREGEKVYKLPSPTPTPQLPK
ncbi:MAG TPA: septum formation initiator family protein [Candidatus Angelobacter sp.]